jgi:hypothetical protein
MLDEMDEFADALPEFGSRLAENVERRSDICLDVARG